MKKIILILATALLPFALCAEDADLSEAANDLGNAFNAFGRALGDTFRDSAEEAGDNLREGLEDARETFRDKVDDVEDSVQQGLEDTGSSIRENAEGIGDSIQQGLESIGNTLQRGADSLGESLREGAAEIKNTAENTQIISATGTLKKKWFSDSYRLVTEDETYGVSTISGSEDSLTRLSGYRNKLVTVTGVLNTESNELTLITYQLADEE